MALGVLKFVFAFWAAAAIAEPVCSDLEARRPACPHPEVFLSHLLETINAHRTEPISKIVAALGFARATVVGAHNSHSLQRTDHPDNPRIYLLTECGPLTMNLFGKTLELGLVKTVSTAPISGTTVQSPRAGEILVEFSQLPREKPYTLDGILNLLDPRYAASAPGSDEDDRFRRTASGKQVAHDSHACSSCHVDAGRDDATHTSMGQTRLSFADGTFLDAIVSPYEREPGKQSDSVPYYCLQDLHALYACRCGEHPVDGPQCAPFKEDGKWAARTPEKQAEACTRLKLVLDLKPTAHCDFIDGPTCLTTK